MALSAKNKRFWAKTRAEQRVAIAKDILKQIADEKVKPKTGAYLYYTNPDKKGLELETPLDKVLSATSHCEVCALGACFVSMVNLGNQITVGQSLRGNGVVDKEDITRSNIGINECRMRSYLRDIFTGRQLALIESAFETIHYTQELHRFKVNMGIYAGHEFVRDASIWGRKFGSARLRLIAIMENIIENEGTFKPE